MGIPRDVCFGHYCRSYHKLPVRQRMNTTTRIIITAVLIGLLVFFCAMDEPEPVYILAVILVSLVVAVPLLIAMHMRDEQLKREREAVRRQCESARQRDRPVDWSKAKGGTLRYPEINLDYSIRKSVQTGRVKEARKPPSADGT